MVSDYYANLSVSELLAEDKDLLQKAYKYSLFQMICRDYELQLLCSKMKANGVYPGKCLVETYKYKPLGKRVFNFKEGAGHTFTGASYPVLYNGSPKSVPTGAPKTLRPRLPQMSGSKKHGTTSEMPALDKLTRKNEQYWIDNTTLARGVLTIFENSEFRPISEETAKLMNAYSIVCKKAHTRECVDPAELTKADLAAKTSLWNDKMVFSAKVNKFLKAEPGSIGKDNWDMALTLLTLFKSIKNSWAVKELVKVILYKRTQVEKHAKETRAANFEDDIAPASAPTAPAADDESMAMKAAVDAVESLLKEQEPKCTQATKPTSSRSQMVQLSTKPKMIDGWCEPSEASLAAAIAKEDAAREASHSAALKEAGAIFRAEQRKDAKAAKKASTKGREAATAVDFPADAAATDASPDAVDAATASVDAAPAMQYGGPAIVCVPGPYKAYKCTILPGSASPGSASLVSRTPKYDSKKKPVYDDGSI
jgi:hypothetical protein